MAPHVPLPTTPEHVVVRGRAWPLVRGRSESRVVVRGRAPSRPTRQNGPIRDFTVCSIRFVYHAKLILSR